MEQQSNNCQESNSSPSPGAIGRAIRNARHKRGLTQRELAQRAGCSATTVHDIESGYYPAVSQRWLDILTTTLHLDADSIQPEAIAPEAPPSGRCLVCGATLFDTPDQVPAGWIVEWHLSDGRGNCLEHTGPQWLKYRMRHQ
jgi:transcriptional regulator with XRE-family HTH domain